MSSPLPAIEREVDCIVALGGDLYLYGGTRTTLPATSQGADDVVLSDILVARAQNGIVTQPWKRFAVSESAPSKQSTLLASAKPRPL